MPTTSGTATGPSPAGEGPDRVVVKSPDISIMAALSTERPATVRERQAHVQQEGAQHTPQVCSSNQLQSAVPREVQQSAPMTESSSQSNIERRPPMSTTAGTTCEPSGEKLMGAARILWPSRSSSSERKFNPQRSLLQVPASASNEEDLTMPPDQDHSPIGVSTPMSLKSYLLLTSAGFSTLSSFTLASELVPPSHLSQLVSFKVVPLLVVFVIFVFWFANPRTATSLLPSLGNGASALPELPNNDGSTSTMLCWP